MLRMFSSARAKSCKTLLLWAHILGVTIATVVVDDSETDKIIYSDWWNVTHLCSGCTRPSGLPSGLPLGDTWRSGFSGFFEQAANFEFKFNGTSVEVYFIFSCLEPQSAQVRYSIDGGEQRARYALDCPWSGYSYNQTQLSIPKLSNGEHTLRVIPGSLLWFDYLIYEAEDPDWATTGLNEEVTGKSYEITTNLSTPQESSTTNLSAPQESGAPSRSTSNSDLGAIVGGVVSGVVLLVFSIVLFLFLKRRRHTRLRETVAPYVVEDASFGVPTPELQNFTGRPNHYSLKNTATPLANQVQPLLPDQPVEAGLMSRSRFPNLLSHGSRRTPATS